MNVNENAPFFLEQHHAGFFLQSAMIDGKPDDRGFDSTSHIC
jgi:hypothetical protein